MNIQKEKKFCPTHGSVLAERPGTNHILHLLLSLITGGLWIIVWVGIAVKFGGWKCPICGSACK
jgi:hypothetical protein